MATEPTFDRPDLDRPSAPAMGGTVEPGNRATVAKERFQTPLEKAGERFELRDPFAEVTYRASSFREMAAKAEQLGSSRFVAVGDDGKRTPVLKVDGEWQRDRQADLQHGGRREPTFEPAMDRPGQRSPGRDREAGATNVVPMPGATTASAQRAQGDGMALAKMEAQAERAARIAGLEAGLHERYVIKRAPVTVGDVTVGRTEYRFRGDTSRVAFTESTFRLATDTNSPSVARSMVDVAETRNWKSLRVSGSEDFKRMVWLEASVRGVKTLGYEPNPADLEVLRREREARLVNRVEPTREAGSSTAPVQTEKAGARGGGGRKAVLAAVEAVLVAKKVPEKQRAAVMAAATEKLAQRTRDGQAPKVKVYDKAAPAQRPVAVPTPELQRSRERTMPAPAR